MKKIILLLSVFILGCSNSEQEDINPVIDENQITISTELSQSLSFMREEEKLARDAYLSLYDIWGLQVFSNIASSEQTHMDAIKGLIDQFGLTDPVVNDERGVFQNPELQNLYDLLLSQGNQSLIEALKVGALIEEVDIDDLNEALEVFNQTDVVTVYENLNKGSRNHLRTFYSQLQSQGIAYEPQILEVNYFYEIVNSNMERGN